MDGNSQFTHAQPQSPSSSSPLSAEGQAAIEYMPTAGATCDTYRLKLYGKLHFLKRLKPQYAGDVRYVQAFRKEFEVGYNLEHPHLAKYISLSDEGILMEYVDGETLTSFLQTHPDYFRSKANSDRFLSQMLSVLQYLHGHQVLHLDLKPDNILITRINHDVKLIDLGGCYADCFNDTTAHTDSYAAPEQLHPTAQDNRLCEATDLYALGRILQQLPCHALYKKVIARSTQPLPASRYQSAEEFRADCFSRKSAFPLFGLLLIILLLAVAFMLWGNKGWDSASQALQKETPAASYLQSAEQPVEEHSATADMPAAVFRSQQDVMIYVLGKRFRQGSYTVEFRTDGIYMNGRCMSFAPVVDTFEGHQAIVTANNPTQGFFRFLIDSARSTATEMSTGEVYTAR